MKSRFLATTVLGCTLLLGLAACDTGTTGPTTPTAIPTTGASSGVVPTVDTTPIVASPVPSETAMAGGAAAVPTTAAAASTPTTSVSGAAGTTPQTGGTGSTSATPTTASTSSGGTATTPSAGGGGSADLTTPQGVANAFFNWYSQQGGNALDPATLSQSQYLSPDYLQKLTAQMASGTPGVGGNPIVCGQNIPSNFTVDNPTINGNTANVTVHGQYAGGNQTNINVTMTQQNGQWLISNIACSSNQ